MVYRLSQIIAICAIAALGITACYSPQQRQATKRNIPIELRDGDVAFRRGMGLTSNIILITNRSGHYSHVGMVKSVNNKWCVIHEVPYEGESEEDDKIYCEEIEEFFNTIKASSGAIYRLEGLDSSQIATVCNYTLKHLECNTPFDHDYDLSDDSKLYCSELAWRSYMQIGIDISNGSRTDVRTLKINSEQIIFPADIETSRVLAPIYEF
ncbi:MAG: YiiX/YebB-like N1pC/P60 family cysteine hydrolase [Rikenellaceae bacterium]